MKSIQKILLISIIFIGFQSTYAQDEPLNLNKEDRQEWFSELGFGMFIHWSFDVQLGMVISHSMVGASEDYLNRYVNELPKTFNPKNFDADQWAQSAKMAGMKYMVFTTKHHNGFCMFNTKTTDFSIMNTPYSKDITKMFVEACTKAGLAVGFYYSPDDFYYLYKNNTLISRVRPEALASNNEGLNAYTKKQMKELMTQYGNVDVMFLDGMDQFAKTELAKICWKINPDVVVTRGAINTPEQKTPDESIPPPWEACYTLGDQWQYRPTNENYKSARTTILKLIEIRAKGGNFLLNFGPDANGDFPSEQQAILNEISLWMFINQEAFDNTEPYIPIREGEIWFLKHKFKNIVFAFLPETNWKYGTRKLFTLNTIWATEKTKISVLGHNSEVLEYSPDVDPAPIVKETTDGMELSIMRAQRIYNNRKWPNPLVIKIEGIEL